MSSKGSSLNCGKRTISKKRHGVLRQDKPVVERYKFIEEHSDEFIIRQMTHVLQVSKSGYDDWLNSEASKCD